MIDLVYLVLSFIHYYLHPCPWPQGQGHRLRTSGNFSKLKSFVYFNFNMETTYAVSWSDMAQPCDIDLWSWNEGQHDLYFTFQGISCVISWSLFHVCSSYFQIMNLYDPRFDLKINVGQFDLYFMVQWFDLISWMIFMYEHPYLGLWISMTWHLTSM